MHSSAAALLVLISSFFVFLPQETPPTFDPSTDPFANDLLVTSRADALPDGTLHVTRIVKTAAPQPFTFVDEHIGLQGEVLSRLAMNAGVVIVNTVPELDHNQVAALAARHGASVVDKLYGPDLYVFDGCINQALANVPAGLPPLAPFIADLMTDAQIVYAEPDYCRFLQVTPNDTSWSSLWGMVKIGAPAAWDKTTGSNTIVIGDIDTGVDYNHADLAANIWSNTAETAGTTGVDDDANGRIDDLRGWDFANSDNNPMDVNGHGTHTTGTIGAVGNNSLGVAGVCWNVKVIPLKTMPDGTNYLDDAAIISSIQYATAKGVRATSNSYGGGGYSTTMYNAIKAARDVGILFVAAAGNSNQNNDATPTYPANYDLANVISVAATTETDGRASFSSYGATTVDLGAPGTNILSTTGGTYASWNGTSMATPHVAGAVALLASYFPGKDGTWIKNRLMNTTTAISALAGKCVSGGRIQVGDAINGLPPTVTIVSPANGVPQLNRPITVSGTASDRDGTVALVTWTNTTTGASGTAVGTTSWTIDNVDLATGSNVIQVTAKDDDGKTTMASRTTVFAPPFTFDAVAVTLNATQNQTDPVSGTITMANAAAVAINWTALSDQTWLGVSPAGGTLAIAGTQPLTMTATISGMMPGTYVSNVMVTEAGTGHQNLVVTLIIAPPPASHHSHGRCGSIGVDLMLPLGLLWLLKRRRKNRA